nr:MAG TPA: hypothetical protein [Bacteriophage sp.]
MIKTNIRTPNSFKPSKQADCSESIKFTHKSNIGNCTVLIARRKWLWGWGLEHAFDFALLSPSNYGKNKKPLAYVLNIIYIILSTTHILYIIIDYRFI